MDGVSIQIIAHAPMANGSVTSHAPILGRCAVSQERGQVPPTGTLALRKNQEAPTNGRLALCKNTEDRNNWEPYPAE